MARDLIGLYGRRAGPVPRIWRRALVVVSRDALLSQREMDYRNFHAARFEDPNGAVRQQVDLGRGGDFQLDFEFRPGQEGQTLFEVFLFWPGAPAQYARCTLSPITVVGAPYTRGFAGCRSAGAPVRS